MMGSFPNTYAGPFHSQDFEVIWLPANTWINFAKYFYIVSPYKIPEIGIVFFIFTWKTKVSVIKWYGQGHLARK